MQLGLILAATFFVLGLTLVVVSNFIAYTVIGEINGRSPADQQISMFFVQSRMGEILRRHRQLFPESPKRRRIYIVGISGLGLMFIAFITAVSANVK